MKFEASSAAPHEISTDVLVVNLFPEDPSPPKELMGVDDRTHGQISQLLTSRSDATNFGETSRSPFQPALPAKNLVLIGSGPRSDFDFRRALQLSILGGGEVLKMSYKNAAFLLRGPLPARKIGTAIAEGFLYASFSPAKFRTTNRTKISLGHVVGLTTESTLVEELNAGLKLGQANGESINFARDLVNLPSNYLTPRKFANEARALAREFGLEVEVLGPDRMEKLGMNALLGVARGSEEPPQLIVLRYKSRRRNVPIVALVGKGLTFDTGGISLKEADGMQYMKFDMAGGAAVLGAMRIISQTKPAVDVLGIVGATENMPSGRAQKPGDVVAALNRKTIEVLNTDAEGRLVLADAIAYARKLGAGKIIDIATLTGAVVIALGETTTGIMGNDSSLVETVLRAAEDVGERMWQLPLFPEYRDLITSDIADVTNIANRKVAFTGQRPAGSIVGGMFLGEFAQDTPWVHLDIAGTAWNSKEENYAPKGPTGVAVKTLARTVDLLAGAS
jgi:leucyl aminopeptidase